MLIFRSCLSPKIGLLYMYKADFDSLGTYPIAGPITESVHLPLPPPNVLRRGLESGPQIPVPSRSPSATRQRAPQKLHNAKALGQNLLQPPERRAVVPAVDRRFLWLGLRYLPRSTSIQTPSARSASRCRSVACVLTPPPLY